MIQLGLRKSTYGTENLVKQNWPPLPTSFPNLPEGHYVVGGLGMDLESFERLFVVETIEEMRQLHDAYQNSGGTRMNWYTGHEEIGVIGGMELLG
jgi:hypothetical protein